LRLELENTEEYVDALESIRLEREKLVADLAEQVSTWSTRAGELEGDRQALVAALDTVQHERDESVAALEAFRRRVSVRLANKLTSALGHVPGATPALRWVLRGIRSRNDAGG
jgi:septal ring factor EnvC (AmiA/AmiB activator)